MREEEINAQWQTISNFGQIFMNEQLNFSTGSEETIQERTVAK